jgi:uncharacterized protein (TIGR03083 family)
MSLLAAADYEDLLKVEVARLSGIDPETLRLDLPHIEGWTVHTVVGHTAWIFRYVAKCLQATPDDRPSRSSVGEPPIGPEVIEWLAEGANDLMDVLGQTDLDTQRPSWTGPQPGHWWLRRVCHEAAMHRWDAYAPSGRPEPIDADQARDGVEEVFEVFVPHRMQFDSLAGSGETIHLHATDIEDGEWRLELLADEVRWERAHAKCDVAARGPVSDLLLLLWSRIPPSELETFGDTALLDRWQHAAAF